MRAIVLMLLLAAATVRADGGTVRTRMTAGPLTVTVFTAPQPPTVGPLDVSVLVQDGAGAPVLDATVAVRLDDGVRTMTHDATRAAATNKLLYAALADVRAPGTWRLDVTVRRGADEAVVATTVPVGPAAPPLRALWPYVATPPLGIALFALHQTLASRRRGVDRTGVVAKDALGTKSEDLDG